MILFECKRSRFLNPVRILRRKFLPPTLHKAFDNDATDSVCRAVSVSDVVHLLLSESVAGTMIDILPPCLNTLRREMGVYIPTQPKGYA